MLRTPPGPQPADGARVSAGFFSTLGVTPILGRNFRPNDDQPNSAWVTLISYAAWQRRYVQVWQATTDEASIGHNFLFEHTGTSSDALLHDQVLHTASLIAVILLIATAAALVAVFIRRKSATEEATFPALPLSILAAGIAFLLTPLSAPLWNHAPEAAFLQFPWRLLAILAPVFALSVAAALDRLPMRLTTIAVAAVALLTLLTLPAYHVFRQECYD